MASLENYTKLEKVGEGKIIHFYPLERDPLLYISWADNLQEHTE